MRSGRIASRKVAPETRRCAIYTRKSTSVGLEQDFNSLDAQREACAAYIQRQPGWTVVDDRYDDGGFTGANIERPAFQRLLTDMEAAKIDVVVVYKVDRLSRSLLDFAKLMERFGRAGASFVSVTQNFSTADAMGRLREFTAGETLADAVEIETSWVARCLADFEAIWDVLTPENRGRLLRAVVQSVEIDEPANRVKVFMVDLSDGLVAPPDDVPHEALA